MGFEGNDDEIAGKICLDCGWSVSANEADSIEDASSQALEHFLETGHAIESTGRLHVLEGEL
ncbi:hypothetical protein ACYJ1Y_12735 [Natrialbaceae archaeon A-gly3]